MNSLTKHKEFFDNGSNVREKENFQGFLFKEVNMSSRNIPISFYRSDFRGAKFQKASFSRNNFSNADFIDSSVINTIFNTCEFTFSELYNSYFEKSNFIDTAFNSASLVKLVFEDCELRKAKFDTSTFRECKFINCKFKDCIFERNSIDDIEFEGTTFKNVDLSNMTAINLFFNDCKFDNVIIDADYLGSYFFKGHFFNNLKLKYRGKIFNLDISQSELLSNFFRIFLENERYYEAINFVIQKNLLEGKNTSIFKLLRMSIEHLLKEESQLKRSYQFNMIFKLLEYYINTEYILISDYFKMLGYLETLDISHFDLFEQIGFTEKVNRLKMIIERIEYTNSFMGGLHSNDKMLVEIRIDEINQKKFEEYFNKVLLEIGASLSIKETPYKILGSRKGSLIYDVIMYSGAALLFFNILKSLIKVARETIQESMHLAIDYKLDSRVLAISKKLKGEYSFEQIKDIKKYQIMSKKAVGKNEDMNIEDIDKLYPLIKSAIIYPNALPEGKN